MTTLNAQPLRFSGEFKVGRWSDDATFGGYDAEVVNFQQLDINPEGTQLVVADKGIANYGQAKYVDNVPKPTKVAIQMDEFTRELLADLLRGLLSTFSQSNGTGSATVTLVKDKWVDLGTMNIDAVVIGTKVLGTDYKVDKVLGQVMALTVDTAGQQTVTFNKGAISGHKIVAGNTKTILLGLAGQVKNHHSGETGVLTIPKMAIDPKSALALINEKNQEGKFDGLVMVPPDGSAPWTFYPTVSMTTPSGS